MSILLTLVTTKAERHEKTKNARDAFTVQQTG